MAGPTADGGREAKRARVEDVIGATESDEWFIGSIDQGTTSSRFIVFDRKGDPVVSHQIEFENLFPKPGYVDATISSRSNGS